MIIDSRNTFLNNVALNTGAPGTYLLGDQIDLGALPGNINGALGEGELPYLVLSVDVGINAASAGTVQFQLASDSTAAIATDATATILAMSPAFATSTTSGNAGGALSAGRIIWAVKLPVLPESERFLGIRQVTGTAAITAGRISAFLTHDVGGVPKMFPDAIN